MSEAIEVVVHEGSGLKGGIFGQKDPYVIIEMGGQKVHTTAVKNQGRNPKWQQTFSLPYTGEKYMYFTVMDRDKGSMNDDLMGQGQLDLSALRTAKRMNTNVPIVLKKKPAGTVRVTINYKGSGMAGYPPQYGAYPPQQGTYPPPPQYGQQGPIPVYSYSPQPQIYPPTLPPLGYPHPMYPQATPLGYQPPPPPGAYPPPPQQGYYGGYPPHH